MDPNCFKGTFTALVTPFDTDGEVDFDAFDKLVEAQIAGGVEGLVAVGTTGESPTLTHEEHIEVIRECVRAARGRVPVLAGTGSNSTAEALELTRRADRAGVAGHLQVLPYYNKPTQEGLFRHFSAVAEATEKPILLYSIPGRCVIEVAVETVARLYEAYPHVCGIKEAGGSCDRVSELRNRLGPDYVIVSGDDSLTLPFVSVGADGVISVASNTVPAEVSEMTRLANANDFAAATKLHLRLYPLFRGLFVESNPVPVKFLMKERGQLPDALVRLPLAPLSESGIQVVREAAQSAGLL